MGIYRGRWACFGFAYFSHINRYKMDNFLWNDLIEVISLKKLYMKAPVKFEDILNSFLWIVYPVPKQRVSRKMRLKF